MTMGDRAARRLIRQVLGDREGELRPQDIEAVIFRVRRAEEDLEIVRDALFKLRDQPGSGEAKTALSQATSSVDALRVGLIRLATEIERAAILQQQALQRSPEQPPGPDVLQ